ncbi:MAG TPA: sugar transferase [Myxococcales bacterium]
MRVARVFHHWCSRRKLALFLVEQGSVAVAFAVAVSLVGRTGGTWRLSGALVLAAAIAFQVAFYFADLYDLRLAVRDRTSGRRLMWGLGTAALLSSPLALAGSGGVSPGAVLWGVAAAVGAAVVSRAALPKLVGAPERVLVVGTGGRARALAEELEASSEVRLQVVAYHDPSAPAALTSCTSVDELAREHGARLVALALEGEAVPSALAHGLLRCRLAGLEVLGAASLAERALRRLPVAHLRAAELALSDGFYTGRLDAFVKRALDLAAALALAVVSAPLVVVGALLVRLDSPGPVFYRQERVGRGGKVFWLTKLRTMRTDAEADGRPVWAREGDERVTRVGRLLRKTRMDELPQILSVLSGDMSFVGPRPERPFFVERIKQLVPFYELREAVKPGITGWAQLRYPYGASIEDARAKLEYDLYYLKNRSLFLDLAIIFHTARHVLTGRGAR